MTTSGVTQNNPVRDEVIRRALRLVGAYSPYKNPSAHQITNSTVALNMMIKSWQVQGFLWLKEFVEIPLVAGQSVYDLPDGVSITFRPTRIFNASRKSTGGSEIILQSMSRSDYQNLTNKTSSGTPVQYYYDPQNSVGKLYVWPVPTGTNPGSLVLDVDRQLQMMVDSSNTYDFPEEWIEVLTYGLAVRIAPEYAVPLNEREALRKEYIGLVDNLMSYNMDFTSTFFGVSYE